MKKIINFIKFDSARWIVGILLLILSLSATIVSTYLSCNGLLNLLKLTNIEITGSKEFTIAFVIILQSIVFVGSIAKTFIYKYCPQHYHFITVFITFAFIISTFSTITFFTQFDPESRYNAVKDMIELVPIIKGSFKIWTIDLLTNMTLIYIGAVALDLMSMKFPGIGSDLIFKMSTTEEIELESKSIIGRSFKIIKFLLNNLFNKIELKIGMKEFKEKEFKDKKEYPKMSLNENEEFKDKEEYPKMSLNKNEESKDKKEYPKMSLNKNEESKDKKEYPKMSLNENEKSKYTKNYPKMSLNKNECPKEFKDNSKDKKFKDNVETDFKTYPKIQKTSSKVIDMVNIEVARYILDQYSDGELIKWNDIKTKFNINTEYGLKKLRKYLKEKDVLRINGKNSYRNNCPKNILKEIKMS